MSEYIPIQEKTPEKKLWFEGPNYTADAVIIDEQGKNILLIERQDTGDWALPGGFIDPEDASAFEAARREANEEVNITLTTSNAALIFRGVVDDPRNSTTAWIETSAYLFRTTANQPIEAGDDAATARWHAIENLPPLYASHEYIVNRAVDHLANEHLASPLEASQTTINAGHMEYAKSFIETEQGAIFLKAHDANRFTDEDRATRAYHYLEKESFVMADLRNQGYTAIPESFFTNDTLHLTALQDKDGWLWRAENDTIDAYIRDTLQAIQTLEQTTISPDTFPIDPSYESLRTEGWASFTHVTPDLLASRFEQFASRFSDKTKASAEELLQALDLLWSVASTPRDTPTLVSCHHDLRQSNLAWHPEHGTKIIDWSWAGFGEKGSDATSFLIDLAKSGHDISPYHSEINEHHCLTLIGFWLAHSTWPTHGDDTVRFQQFLSAVSGYEVLKQLH